MKKYRILEDYRQHKLLAAIHDGKCKGRIWKHKDIVHEQLGSSPESLIIELRTWVDNFIDIQASENGLLINETNLMKSFNKILTSLSDGQLAMLKAHVNAPNMTITATDLAKAANYTTFSAANLQYGLIGKSLQELEPINLPKRHDGTLIYTCYLATGDNALKHEDHWKWILKPEIANVIKYLGLNI